MITLLFSTYSSGSTFLQTQIAPYMDVLGLPDWELREREFPLLHWGAYFVFAPNETIDFEPVRTFNPNTGKEQEEWRANYRDYLSHSAQEIGRFYPDPETDDWITVERFFLDHLIEPLKTQYDLPTYSESYPTRVDYVIDVFRALEKSRRIFGKNPKWLNDFSGYTFLLFDQLIKANVNIRGIFLRRCPADTFASIYERKFRLDEVFKGDTVEYGRYVLDSIEYSTKLGIMACKEYDFFEIKYESIVEAFPALMDYLGIKKNRPLRYRRKYGHRYVLNPKARELSDRLFACGKRLGYQYPGKITIVRYFQELFIALFFSTLNQRVNVNNPESPRSILSKCFWYEISTDKALPIRKAYRYIFKKE